MRIDTQQEKNGKWTAFLEGKKWCWTDADSEEEAILAVKEMYHV